MNVPHTKGASVISAVFLPTFLHFLTFGILTLLVVHQEGHPASLKCAKFPRDLSGIRCSWWWPRKNRLMTSEKQADKRKPRSVRTCVCQWCGLRPLVLGQDRSETKKSVVVLQAVVLVLHTAVSVLVLQFWCCFVKHDLVTLVVIMILKDTTTFQVLFTVYLFCVWNITTVEINSGIHLLKS